MQPTFDNSFSRLPDRFYARQAPIPVSQPGNIRVNDRLSATLGIDPGWLRSEEGIAVMAGNRVPDGADPLAMVYAGHQFGHWNPRLGDGRAILLGEIIGTDGERYDVQLKGSGQTPFSRSGDGRAPLGPVLREYIVSEAMAALGIPTTRSLAVVSTGDPVYREEKLAGGILARVAKSHIRIGTLQYFGSTGDVEGLKLLVDHVIERHYPEAMESANPVLSLFEGVIHRQASLVARWQGVGFIHGVMNTDNMLLSGETIDYGPCAFMDAYDPATVYSYIDQGGRYAFSNQPGIAHWNLSCLAQALLPLLCPEPEEAIELAQTTLDAFPALYEERYVSLFREKLGLSTVREEDEKLIQDFLDLLYATSGDHTLAFRRLGELTIGDDGLATLFEFADVFEPWLSRWRDRCAFEAIDAETRCLGMAAVNPALIPRNHQVEKAISQAYEGDFTLFHRLADRLETPYVQSPEDRDLMLPPAPEEVVQQTFCGT